MQTITTIGLDIAKSVFQVHGVDAGGQVIVRRQLKRRVGTFQQFTGRVFAAFVVSRVIAVIYKQVYRVSPRTPFRNC
jgi:transposase